MKNNMKQEFCHLCLCYVCFEFAINAYCALGYHSLLLKNTTTRATFFGNPPINWFLRNPPPPLKIGFFSDPIILKFFILNPIPFFKVTNFLVKIPHFKFLVMTEKHFWFIIFFCHYIFQISVYFLFTNFNPLKKVTPPFSTTPF